MLLVRRAHAPWRGYWDVPGGFCEPREHPITTAEREVREEAGVEAALVGELGEVRYWYQRSGKKIPKLVTFFLFEYRSGSDADHDAEVEEVRWLPLEEAVAQLSYKGERQMVERALALRR